ncbi:MAG: sigma-54-dependent transcriptional regulator [Planctomycetota bacterium]
MSARVLVVDDEKLIRWGLCQSLKDAGYGTEQAGTVSEALDAVGREMPDLLLLDYKLPDGSGIDVLRSVRKASPRTPVVMITAHASVGGAVEAMKEGAYDYLGKPFELDEVIQTVGRALEAGHLREVIARSREDARKESALDNIVASSPGMQEVVRLIRRIAESEASTILLLGESGVGKGLVARALHFAGPRWEKPFMHITCTALPEALLESELFGHEKGSFTDAKVQKKGLFELADGGTVFLDEIGDLPQGMQGKLLRVLEDKAFRRVGGSRDIQVSVRIVAATNKDLAKEVEAGRFRSDLYFRLRVIPIEIPPLRERVEDLVPLADSIVRHFNRELRKNVGGFDADAIAMMKRYAWPGNVRELRNAIERAVLLTDGARLTCLDLPSEIRNLQRPGTGGSDTIRLPPGGLVLEELEREMVIQALARSRGNRTRAAEFLGLNRDQIRYRIEKFGLGNTPVNGA